MPAITVLSLVQPALAVEDISAGIDRVRQLFDATPSELNDRQDFVNAVFAFEDATFLELLDGLHEGHTRDRFLKRNGPGMYMLCVDIAEADPADIEAQLQAEGIRVVAPGRRTENIKAGWHLHPGDAASILTLLAMKSDPLDNGDWAGHDYPSFVPGNTRFAHSLRGVIARTHHPAEDAASFGRFGFTMEARDTTGAHTWSGPRTCLELWPASHWKPEMRPEPGRDYALLFTADDPHSLITRLTKAGLELVGHDMQGRWLTSVDPVLGVRIAIEATSR